MYKFDLDGLLKQISINYKERYVQWEPSKLLDNVWDVTAVAMKVIRQVEENNHLHYVSKMTQINKHTWRWYYVDKREEKIVDEL